MPDVAHRINRPVHLRIMTLSNQAFIFGLLHKTAPVKYTTSSRRCKPKYNPKTTPQDTSFEAADKLSNRLQQSDETKQCNGDAAKDMESFDIGAVFPYTGRQNNSVPDAVPS